jgi:hypothetical protein
VNFLFGLALKHRARGLSFWLAPQAPGAGIRPLGYLVLTRARGRAGYFFGLSPFGCPQDNYLSSLLITEKLWCWHTESVRVRLLK